MTTTTVTSSLSTCSLVIHYRTSDNSVVGATDNQVRPEFIVENTGTEVVNLSDVTFRYWYTKEGTSPEQIHIDYAAVGAANITTAFESLPEPVATADSYLEIGFTSAAGTVAAGATSGNICLLYTSPSPRDS